MKGQEVRDLSDVELRTREHELADELFHLRLKRAASQLPNPMKVRQTRRDLARVKTVLRQREAVSAPKEEGGRARERSSRPTGLGASEQRRAHSARAADGPPGGLTK
jgi:large subunit ribosomal protein L29